MAGVVPWYPDTTPRSAQSDPCLTGGGKPRLLHRLPRGSEPGGDRPSHPRFSCKSNLTTNVQVRVCPVPLSVSPAVPIEPGRHGRPGSRRCCRVRRALKVRLRPLFWRPVPGRAYLRAKPSPSVCIHHTSRRRVVVLHVPVCRHLVRHLLSHPSLSGCPALPAG